MNMRTWTTIIAAAMLLTGCGQHSSSALPAPASMTASRGVVLPTGGVDPILQTSGQWTDFMPAGSNGTISGVIVGADRQMWANQGGPMLYHYTMPGVLKTYTLNVSGNNGPGTQLDAAVMELAGTNIYANGQDAGWGGTGIFGVITPQHVVNVYAIPSGDTPNDMGIAYDPINKTVWMVENSHIARIDTTTNAITEYLTNPTDIAVAYGPDGNIWAYGGGPSQLTVFNPNDGSVIATYPFTCGFLYSLIAGGDGNLYGAGAGCGNFIAKIGIDGSVARIALPHIPAPSSQNIALVGNGIEKGHIFMDENGTHNLVDFDPASETVSEIQAPAQFQNNPTTGMTVGPDGNIWTADLNGNLLVYAPNLITANPTSITVGVGNTLGLTASEPDGYHLKATSSKTSIATVVKVRGVTGSYTVTGISVGHCTITLKDNIGNSLKVPVMVQ